MKLLELSDKRNLIAALGWLELGNSTESETELGRIIPLFRARPSVMRTGWCVYAGVSQPAGKPYR